MHDKTTILLVEDDPIDRLAFERHVHKNEYPYQYLLAGSVHEAQEMLGAHTFDALILDYMLGDGTAFDLINMAGQSAIIMVTGLGDEGIAVAAMKAGAADYLVKDTQGRYLITLPLIIERAIRNKKNELELSRYRNNLEHMVTERTSALAAEIHQHQRAEKALIESEKHWERTFDAINDMIVILDADRIIIKANQAAAKVLDLTPQDLTGKPYYALFRVDKEDSIPCPVENCTRQEQGLTVEYQFKQDQTHLVSCSPVYNQEGTIVEIVLVGKNITDQKQLERQLIQAQKMEAIGALAGGISHDFNNILTGILGFSQLALNQVEPESFVYTALDGINTAGLRARDLVRQILTFSRKSPESKQLMQIQPIIKEGLHLLRASIPSTITIRQDIDPNCGFIMANPIQLHQVLMNLCANASHAMEKTGGDLRISMKEMTFTKEQCALLNLPHGRYIRLSVQDSGTGIAPEILPRIFEPFFTTKGLGKGTGMGLSVVHGIVKEIGGTIVVESERGVGSLFQAYFPLLRSNEQEADTVINNTPLPSGSGRILFVDDEEQIRSFSETMLKELGYKVTLAENGMKAWHIFTAKPEDFDLVITDKTMPGINGLALSSKIRSVRPDLPIILSSGDQTGVISPMLASIGIHKLLIKPFVIRDLAVAAHEALTQQQQNPDSKKDE